MTDECRICQHDGVLNCPRHGVNMQAALAPTDYVLPLGPLEAECVRLAARVAELERAANGWMDANATLEGNLQILLRRIRERNIVIKELSKGSIDLGPEPRHPIDDPSTHVFYMLWQNSARMAQHYAHLVRYAFRERNRAYKYSRSQDKALAKLGRKVGVLRAANRHWWEVAKNLDAFCEAHEKQLLAYTRKIEFLTLERDSLKIALESQLTLNAPAPAATATESDRARGDFGVGFAHTAQPYAEDQAPAATPAPEPHYAEQFGINPAPGYATPEPSAEKCLDLAEAFQRENEQIKELLATSHHANCLTMGNALLARAETAEARLAAVREAVRATDDLVRRCIGDAAKDIIVLGYSSIRKALSPGGGTGGGK